MQVIAYYNYDAADMQAPYELQGLFGNTVTGRRKLLEAIFSDKRIKYKESDKAQIEWRIVHAFPSAANELISGGCVRIEEVVG